MVILIIMVLVKSDLLEVVKSIFARVLQWLAKVESNKIISSQPTQCRRNSLIPFQFEN